MATAAFLNGVVALSLSFIPGPKIPVSSHPSNVPSHPENSTFFTFLHNSNDSFLELNNTGYEVFENRARESLDSTGLANDIPVALHRTNLMHSSDISLHSLDIGDIDVHQGQMSAKDTIQRVEKSSLTSKSAHVLKYDTDSTNKSRGFQRNLDDNGAQSDGDLQRSLYFIVSAPTQNDTSLDESLPTFSRDQKDSYEIHKNTAGVTEITADGGNPDREVNSGLPGQIDAEKSSRGARETTFWLYLSLHALFM